MKNLKPIACGDCPQEEYLTCGGMCDLYFPPRKESWIEKLTTGGILQCVKIAKHALLSVKKNAR